MEKVGEVVTLAGVVTVIRKQKKMVFMYIKREFEELQVIVFDKTPEIFLEAQKILEGSIVEVSGKIVESKFSKTSGIEMQVETLSLISAALPSPISENSSFEAKMEHRLASLKLPKEQSVFVLRSSVEFYLREYLHQQKFIECHTPCLVSGGTESGAEVFEVKYFDTKAYLAQSPQFYKQMLIAAGFEKVYVLGPVFRAEQSYSSRHMTEFVGLDLEIGYIFSVHELIEIQKAMLIHVYEKLRSEEKFKSFEFESPLSSMSISLKEAKKMLIESGRKTDLAGDLTDEEERFLYEKTQTDLIFVYDYPISVRPFYHKWDEEAQTTKSYDLIFRGIEITTGAIREHSLEKVIAQAKSKKIEESSLTDYLKTFQGCPEHGGMGVGLDRFIMKLAGLSSVKEACLFPRDPTRLTP